MAKTKKATPSPADEKIYDVETTYKDKDGSDISISINSTIEYAYLSALIQIIAQTVVDKNGYYPYYYDSALYGYILEFYTNFDKSTGLSEVDKLLYETDIKDVLHKNIVDYQWTTIFDSVDKMIEYRKQYSIKSEIDDMFRVGKELLIKASTAFDELLGSDTLNPETIQKMVGNLANMQVSEKGLIDALVNTTKGKGGRKTAGKNKAKDNVIDLPPIGQQKMDGTEVTE